MFFCYEDAGDPLAEAEGEREREGGGRSETSGLPAGTLIIVITDNIIIIDVVMGVISESRPLTLRGSCGNPPGATHKKKTGKLVTTHAKQSWKNPVKRGNIQIKPVKLGTNQ